MMTEETRLYLRRRWVCVVALILWLGTVLDVIWISGGNS